VESFIWRGGNGHCDKCSCAAVQNEVHVFFHCQDSCLCALSEKSTLSFSSLSANPFLWRPLIFHMPCLVRLSLIFFFSTAQQTLPLHFGYYGLFFGWRRPATKQSARRPGWRLTLTCNLLVAYSIFFCNESQPRAAVGGCSACHPPDPQ